MPGKLAYEKETYILAQKHGYHDPYTLIKTEYLNGKSTYQIGEMIDKSAPAVRNHLVRMGIKMRSRGGANYVPRKITKPSQFLILCKLCGKKIEETSFDKLEEGMKVHKCKGEENEEVNLSITNRYIDV